MSGREEGKKEVEKDRREKGGKGLRYMSERGMKATREMKGNEKIYCFQPNEKKTKRNQCVSYRSKIFAHEIKLRRFSA